MMVGIKRMLFLAIAFSTVLTSCHRNSDELYVEADGEEGVPTILNSIETDVKMVPIAGGRYLPFYGAVDSADVYVAPFLMDERAVTNEEFLRFVEANPQWRKSNVKAIYADSTYLRHWPSDLELPEGANPKAPVTSVSWYAAKAFAKSVGKRLPTVDEWEFVAMADQETANAREKKSYSDNIISLYLIKEREKRAVKQSPPNYWGVYNVFDLIWEWTEDFNSVISMGDSRTGEASGSLYCAAGAASVTDIMNYAAFMRFSMRASVKADYCIANLGFRCAKDIED